jgi:hypothetical protein
MTSIFALLRGRVKKGEGDNFQSRKGYLGSACSPHLFFTSQTKHQNVLSNKALDVSPGSNLA